VEKEVLLRAIEQMSDVRKQAVETPRPLTEAPRLTRPTDCCSQVPACCDLC
jgi:hypothetical protein